MNRRAVIALLGGAAAWPLAARAQQGGPMPRIGFLGSASPQGYTAPVAAFRQGLHETGYSEGQNVSIEFRWANDRYESLPALAAELVGLDVAVIVAAGGAQSALAAQQATRTIPIVFQNGSDPVKLGLVASFSRPGGNITGVTNLTVATSQKRLELIRELLPDAKRIAWFANPLNPNASTLSQEVAAAARSLGLDVVVMQVAAESELDAAFAMMSQRRTAALVLSADPFFTNRGNTLIGLAARHGIPTMYPYREHVRAGGLMSYGASFGDTYRQVGLYVSQVLKGARPADLPVVQPTKFELVINLKTARALGLDIPPTLLARADEVIE